jgi:hypothetical protein
MKQKQTGKPEKNAFQVPLNIRSRCAFYQISNFEKTVENKNS